MKAREQIALRTRRLWLRWSLFFWRQARKIVIAVIGGTVLLIGIAGLVLPVIPGWVLIFVGLGMLATEFAWARWVLRVAKDRFAVAMQQASTLVSGNGAKKQPVPPAVPTPTAEKPGPTDKNPS